MQRSLIDTDILSFYLKGDPVVIKHFENYLAEFDCISFSIITYYEINSGLLFKDANRLLKTFEKFTPRTKLSPWILAHVIVPLNFTPGHEKKEQP
jgi:tRNA(fMet)-specific endonuclease VapC